eukprot:Gb_16455 [translate_table: standard]
MLKDLSVPIFQEISVLGIYVATACPFYSHRGHASFVLNNIDNSNSLEFYVSEKNNVVIFQRSPIFVGAELEYCRTQGLLLGRSNERSLQSELSLRKQEKFYLSLPDLPDSMTSATTKEEEKEDLRWLMQTEQEAEAWEAAKKACRELLFLAIQESLESDSCARFRLMFDMPSPPV